MEYPSRVAYRRGAEGQLAIAERALRGKGYGTEAVRLICEDGIFFRSLHAIQVEVNDYNRRAIRLYERLGFRMVGRLRQATVLNSKRYDQIVEPV